MHAMLRIDRAQVMVSDRTSKQEPSAGSNVHVVLDFTDPVEMARRFDALASTGTVHMAIHDAFWGDKFGALQDKYGVHWMFTCALSERPAS